MSVRFLSGAVLWEFLWELVFYGGGGLGYGDWPGSLAVAGARGMGVFGLLGWKGEGGGGRGEGLMTFRVVWLHVGDVCILRIVPRA